jgi:hypothetical protein
LIDIATYRLASQQISASQCSTAQETVAWLGAVQAQDYPMAKWAIGLRFPNATDSIIEQAIDNAEIIRTHIMRPTWHFVSAKDIRWMMELTAPHLKRTATAAFRKFGLDEKLIVRCNKIIEKSLRGKQLTREEIMLELQKNKIPTHEMRSIYIMFNAEINGIVCNGSKRNKQHTYALLDERVPHTKNYKREEALAELAKRYFSSHGFATLYDFVWWSGLPVGDARKGIESSKDQLACEKISGKEYWYNPSLKFKTPAKESIYFLPAFDEYMVSYKDRSASLDVAHFSKAIYSNGIFKPIIVHNGQVIAIWKRTLQKDKYYIEPQFFKKSFELDKSAMNIALKKHAVFLNSTIELK